MSSVHDIDEGYTQDYLVHGVVALAVAGIMLLVHWSWTIALCLVAVIDVPGKKARVYKALLKWKFGEWLKTPTFSRIELIYTNEAQVMNYKSISTNVRTRTYELVLQGASAIGSSSMNSLTIPRRESLPISWRKVGALLWWTMSK
ncbi:MAG: hypothetical protein IPI55_17550 [Flavobacteriales bacterium]|nr:hypothetical protein [Flavobacteriales bacterium]